MDEDAASGRGGIERARSFGDSIHDSSMGRIGEKIGKVDVLWKEGVGGWWGLTGLAELLFLWPLNAWDLGPPAEAPGRCCRGDTEIKVADECRR